MCGAFQGSERSLNPSTKPLLFCSSPLTGFVGFRNSRTRRAYTRLRGLVMEVSSPKACERENADVAKVESVQQHAITK